MKKARLEAELELLLHEYDNLKYQLEDFENKRLEIKMTLNSLEELKEGDETLISLGSGVFVKGNIVNTKKMVVSVGSNIFVEKSLEDTKKLLENEINILEEAQSKIKARLNELANKINQIEAELA